MIKLEDWIDFMEGESDQKKHGQLGMLLQHSHDDKMIFDNLVRLRQILLNSDPADQIETQLADTKRMQNLHAQIMASVTSLDPEPDQNSIRAFCKP